MSGTTDLVKLIGRDGKKLGNGEAPNFGWGLDPNEKRFNPLTLTAGDWADGPDQVVIDAGSAKKENYKVGDKIRAPPRGRRASSTSSASQGTARSTRSEERRSRSSTCRPRRPC